jgi:hypothetical protein
MGEHRIDVYEDPLDAYYDVTCTCGFEVTHLSSREAADDTMLWHLGEPSMLGDALEGE